MGPARRASCVLAGALPEGRPQRLPCKLVLPGVRRPKRCLDVLPRVSVVLPLGGSPGGRTSKTRGGASEDAVEIEGLQGCSASFGPLRPRVPARPSFFFFMPQHVRLLCLLAVIKCPICSYQCTQALGKRTLGRGYASLCPQHVLPRELYF